MFLNHSRLQTLLALLTTVVPKASKLGLVLERPVSRVLPHLGRVRGSLIDTDTKGRQIEAFYGIPYGRVTRRFAPPNPIYIWHQREFDASFATFLQKRRKRQVCHLQFGCWIFYYIKWIPKQRHDFFRKRLKGLSWNWTQIFFRVISGSSRNFIDL